MIIHGDRILLVAPEGAPSLAPDDVPFRLGGAGDAEARRLVREGLARPLLADVLVSAGTRDRLDVRLAALRLVLGPLVPRFSGPPEAGGFVVGYATAAWVLGSGVPPAQVDVVIAPNTGRVRRPGLRTHEHRLAEDDVLRLGGLWVTTPERTAADLARQRPTDSGLDDVALRAVLDRVREETGLSPAGVLARLEAMAHGRGVVAARQRVLRWALEQSRPARADQSPRLPVTR